MALFIFFGISCTLLYVPLQIFTTLCTRGLARRVSIVPIPIAIVIGAATIIGYVHQIDLWPVCILFTSPLAVLYLVVCLFAYYVNSLEGELKCDRCEFSLRGMPHPGVCPECGTPFP